MPTLTILSWRAQAWRGAMAILFGLLACVLAHISLLALVLGFGAFAVVDGVIAAVGAVASTRAPGHRWPDALVGIVGIVCGSVALLAPPLRVADLARLVACWAILTGVTQLLVAARLQDEVPGEVLLAQAGAIGLAFGIFTFRFPLFTAASFALLLGAYVFVVGGFFLAFSRRLRATRLSAPAAASSSLMTS